MERESWNQGQQSRGFLSINVERLGLFCEFRKTHSRWKEDEGRTHEASLHCPKLPFPVMRLFKFADCSPISVYGYCSFIFAFCIPSLTFSSLCFSFFVWFQELSSIWFVLCQACFLCFLNLPWRAVKQLTYEGTLCLFSFQGCFYSFLFVCFAFRLLSSKELTSRSALVYLVCSCLSLNMANWSKFAPAM